MPIPKASASVGVLVFIIVLLLLVIGVVIWAIVSLNQSGNGKNSRKCSSSDFYSGSVNTGCQSDFSRGDCPSSPNCSIPSSSSSSSSANCRSACSKQFAQFSESGTQTILPGQPLTLTADSITPSDGITKTDGVVTNLSLGSGSVFMIEKRGIYQINFQLTTTTSDVGLSVAMGVTAQQLSEIDYTIVGQPTGSSQIVGSILVHVPSNSMVLAVIGATKNATNIVVPAFSSAANVAVTTVGLTRYQ